MSTPDVRVRLTPEGIKEVLFALRQVEAESKKSREAAGTGIGAINSALRDLKSLLPGIGLAAVVAGFAAMTNQAIKTADQTGKLQQAVGGTVEEISGLTLAFRTNESDQAGLRGALLKTANVLGQVRSGSTEALDALQAIGIDKSIANQSTPRALETIAKQLAAIEDPGKRAAAAAQIFGKQSGELLTALNAVGTQGIDPFIEKAKQLGVLIDDDLANAAARANDALGIIKLQAEGLATQFAAGLAPAIADAMETFSDAVTGDGVNGMRKFGEIVGFVVRTVVALFTSMGKIIGARVAQVVAVVSAAVDAAKALARGSISEAGAALKRGGQEVIAIQKELQSDLAGIAQHVIDGPKEPAPRDTRGTEGAVDPNVALAEQRKQLAARLALRQQSIDAESKLQQEALKSEDQANKTAYDQGLLSLAQYYDKRRELQDRANTQELASLRAQRLLLVQQLNTGRAAGGPEDDAAKAKLRQQIAAIDGQIQQKQLEGAREIAGLDAERTAAVKELQQQLDAANTKLLDLEGKRHEVFDANLAAEIKSLRELGVRAGQSMEEIDNQVARLTNARTAAFNFDEASRTAEQKLDSFNRDAQQVARDQQAGIITQIEGQQRLIELERARLPVLQEMAKHLTDAARATGSDEQIAKAQAFADSIDEIAKSYQAASDFGTQFKNTGAEAFQQGLATMLANADKIHSIGDAFKSLARSVLSTLQQMVAQILAQQATLALLRAFGASSGAGGAAGAAVAGAQFGGYVRGYASGGDIRGPQLPIRGPDNIPILGQKGEFMMRKARVAEPGALSFLRAWNDGRFSLAQALRMPRYATGGPVGNPAGTPAPAGQGGDGSFQLRVVNVVDPAMINDALASSGGERAILNVIRKNSSDVRRLIGG